MTLKYQNQADWAERVAEFELDVAMKKLSKGVPMDQIMHELAHRISNKIMHPIVEALNKSVEVSYDPESAREEYFKNHPSSKVADHMNDVD